MADIQAKNRGRKGSTPRVDLTPMVDLVFLLITFFMFTSTMTKPTAMDLQIPYKPSPEGTTAFYESSAITLIPSKNGTFYYYSGLFDDEKHLQIAKNIAALRAVLIQKQQSLRDRVVADERNLQVLIKPHDQSTVNDLVNVLDEMTILKIPTYAIVDISNEETKVLLSQM